MRHRLQIAGASFNAQVLSLPSATNILLSLLIENVPSLSVQFSSWVELG